MINHPNRSKKARLPATSPGEGWELNGLRFVKGQCTETFHADDFPVYAAAPELLKALELVARDLDIPGMPFCTIDTALAVRNALAKAGA